MASPSAGARTPIRQIICIESCLSLGLNFNLNVDTLYRSVSVLKLQTWPRECLMFTKVENDASKFCFAIVF